MTDSARPRAVRREYAHVRMLCKMAEGSGHELKTLGSDREADVETTAIAVLVAAASALAWPHYQQLLGRFTRIMGRDASKARPLIMVLCLLCPLSCLLPMSKMPCCCRPAYMNLRDSSLTSMLTWPHY